jgi:tRNA-splicing ligase RtcB (3'-phosphate/5'-hydroxy nucleic acid ligase)
MKITKIKDAVWRMEKEGAMKADGIIFATEKILEKMKTDRSLMQLANVASLEGIVGNALLMPDGHEGYGFPIGGVAAFDAEDGIISPGGIGYDINCGVRLIRTGMKYEDLKPKVREIADALFTAVPSGVGSESRLRLPHEELDKVALGGAEWAVENGYGWKDDLQKCEEYGRMDGADPAKVTPSAKSRGKSQLGTLGAGNHFLEIQRVESTPDPERAKVFGMEEGDAMVMVHCGSRGYGHQICTDSLARLLPAAQEMGLQLPDRELVYAPIKSRQADDYLAGMRCAVNFAFANRQMIMHWVRETFAKVLGSGAADKMSLVYDVAHNIAKIEEHEFEGKRRKLMVHRKGATRAFPAGRPELPEIYRQTGHPVIIPGSMGTSSYVLAGTQSGLGLSWGTTCHGAGRQMSRSEAIRTHNPDAIVKGMNEQGIYVRAKEKQIIAEEAPGSYKNVEDVVESVVTSGITAAVAKLRPVAVVKG